MKLYKTSGLYIGKYAGIPMLYQIDFDVNKITVLEYESELKRYIVAQPLSAKTPPLQYVYLASIENFEWLQIYDHTYNVIGGDRETLNARMNFNFNWADMMALWFVINDRADTYLYVDAFNGEIMRQFSQGDTK